jgi:hypothetical protein
MCPVRSSDVWRNRRASVRGALASSAQCVPSDFLFSNLTSHTHTRTHARAQVTIYRLLTAGTIEERIYHRQLHKHYLQVRLVCPCARLVVCNRAHTQNASLYADRARAGQSAQGSQAATADGAALRWVIDCAHTR